MLHFQLEPVCCIIGVKNLLFGARKTLILTKTIQIQVLKLKMGKSSWENTKIVTKRKLHDKNSHKTEQKLTKTFSVQSMAATSAAAAACFLWFARAALRIPLT